MFFSAYFSLLLFFYLSQLPSVASAVPPNFCFDPPHTKIFVLDDAAQGTVLAF